MGQFIAGGFVRGLGWSATMGFTTIRLKMLTQFREERFRYFKGGESVQLLGNNLYLLRGVRRRTQKLTLLCFLNYLFVKRLLIFILIFKVYRKSKEMISFLSILVSNYYFLPFLNHRNFT